MSLKCLLRGSRPLGSRAPLALDRFAIVIGERARAARAETRHRPAAARPLHDEFRHVLTHGARGLGARVRERKRLYPLPLVGRGGGGGVGASVEAEALAPHPPASRRAFPARGRLAFIFKPASGGASGGAAGRRWTRRRCLCGRGDRPRRARGSARGLAWRAPCRALRKRDASSARACARDEPLRPAGPFGRDRTFVRARGAERHVGFHHRHRLAWSGARCPQVRAFVRRAEGNGDAVRAGARGAADAVDVLLRHVRQVEVDDVGDVVDVDAARGDFGGDENARLALLEAIERTGALALALVAVDGVGVEAGAFELLRDAVGAVLGAGEHQRALDAPCRPACACRRSCFFD